MPTPGPQEDRVHAPRDDPRWRESYYFSFFDDELGIGGFSSIGKRPSRGHSGFINVIWGPEIPTLVASEFDRVEGHTDEHAVAGLTYASDEPFGTWRLGFQGRLNDGGDGVECDHGALGPVASSELDSVEVAFDLGFGPSADPYLYEERDEWHDLFDGHVDEVGAVTGTLTIGGERHEVNGRGGKDHSWGVRDWYKPTGWRWLDVVGAGGPELVTWRANFGGDWIGDGAVFGEGGTGAIERFEERVDVAERERKPRPERLELSAAGGGQELELEAETVRVVPIFFSRESEGVRLTSWNDRVLMRCRRPDQTRAWANAEFESLLREPAG